VRASGVTTPWITEAPELSTPAELGAALVGKVYSEESFKGENISHLSCAFKERWPDKGDLILYALSLPKFSIRGRNFTL
jgi:hypothetical protein